MRLPICDPLNKLLDGGLEMGAITNFYGPPATGKSQIALAAAIAVVNAGKKAIFVDTEGGFSVERLAQMCDGSAKGYTDNIILLEPKNWNEQKESIRKLQKICSREQIGLVIVDSIVALWRLAITDENAAQINRELATQLSILSRVAREQRIPVLITNQVYSDIETGKIEMSGRNIVKWWSKNIIELAHAGRTGCRLATIRKARSLPEDKQVEFQIVADGLKDVRFRFF
jgi:DNA repair protein RadB